jgi:DNA-3-methyladenine glycosylase II
VSRRAHKILKIDPVMGRLIETVGPCRLSPRLEREPFESLARAIAHQQLNGTAAERILGRFVALATGVGPADLTPAGVIAGDVALAAPTALFPTPAEVLAAPDDRLRSIGFSFAKVAALKDLAAKTLAGVVPAAAELAVLTDEAIIERLTAVRGIGRWTAEMLLIFQLGRPDVLPVDDFGVRNGFRLAYGLAGMPRPRALAEFGERWRPHRTMAAWYLWRAVELARKECLPARVGPAPRIALQALARKTRTERLKITVKERARKQLSKAAKKAAKRAATKLVRAAAPRSAARVRTAAKRRAGARR